MRRVKASGSPLDSWRGLALVALALPVLCVALMIGAVAIFTMSLTSGSARLARKEE